jgi:GTPase SAR1 family protein
VDDVMEHLNFGPNGALVYCMEFLLSRSDWLMEQLGDYDDDYLIFDLPGQIELYSHISVMTKLIQLLQNQGLQKGSVVSYPLGTVYALSIFSTVISWTSPENLLLVWLVGSPNQL